MSHVWVPLCVCMSVPTCLVGVRTVHHDVRFWRGCCVLRHIRVNGFFLAKENTIVMTSVKIRKATAETENAPNQMGVQNRKYAHTYREKENGNTSTSWCQCSMGLRGFANMAVQCSLPGPSASLPTRHIPITSLWPILMETGKPKRESTLGGQRMGMKMEKQASQILNYSVKYEKRQDQMREEDKPQRANKYCLMAKWLLWKSFTEDRVD